MSQSKKSLGTTEWLALLVLGGAAMLLISRSGSSVAGSQPVPQGTPLPTLMATGWLNVDGPTPGKKSLRGKVVVVDFWATTCPPCRAAMPKLAKAYAQYRSMGVEFLGLTYEKGDDLPAVENLVESVDGLDWPIGYGAGPTFEALNIRAMPTLVVFDAEGVSIWSGHDLSEMQNAVDQALAKK